jgi:predicted Fe-Mo cluster-binding NifX family protein
MNITRLAIGTSDGVSVCEHLARAAEFRVFDLEGGRIISEATRSRGGDGCGNHKTFVELLDGCHAVICGGVGQGAVDSLGAHGVQVLVAASAFTIAGALERYVAGSLPTTSDRQCLCG